VTDTTHEQHRDRLPHPGAGFIWDEARNGVEAYPVLRPETNPRCAAVYSTRIGGVSEAPFDKLNVSSSVGDGFHRVMANRDLAARPIGGGPFWSTIKQVHGSDVVAAHPSSRNRSADAQWTEEEGPILSVLSADCVLVLLTGDLRVGVAHAGWRGVLAGVVENAVEAVEASAAWLGPAIGPCCFEVGPEVVEEFSMSCPQAVTDERHVDLWVAAEAAARRAGASTVHAARICTSCHPELFFSHRRDQGMTGRQALIARLGG
jgi:purine-nucleoside/S-methyl-5'-thioadenosine phosphorylase / adenosine deaminase